MSPTLHQDRTKRVFLPRSARQPRDRLANLVGCIVGLAAAAGAISGCSIDVPSSSASALVEDAAPTSCTLVGCSGPTFEVTLPAVYDAVRALDADACVNKHCCRAALDVGAEAPVPNHGFDVRWTAKSFEGDGGFAECPTGTVWNKNGSFVLSVTWPRLSIDDLYGSPAAAGDLWWIRLVQPNGSFSEGSTLTATGYDATYPNGPTCGPVCWYPRFDGSDAGPDAR